MKVYIYGYDAEALALAERVKGDGHKAVIRNPEAFGDDVNPDLNCDLAITSSDKIAAAFTAKGVEVAGFDYKPKEEVIFKSADTGEFVSEETAKANPKTTYATRKRRNAAVN